MTWERRHRIYGREIPEVRKAAYTRLWYHLEFEDDLYDAEALFKLFYRLNEHTVGRPAYPEDITWETIREYLEEAREQDSELGEPLMGDYNE
jgi:hypothetical protein